MKKLFIVLSVLCLVCCFTAGTVFAQGNNPKCKVFMQGPGSYKMTTTTTMALNPPYCMDSAARCGMWDYTNGCGDTAGYEIHHCATTCDQATMLPYPAITTIPIGTHNSLTGTPIPAGTKALMIRNRKFAQMSPASGGLGTMEVMDWTNWSTQQCMNRYTATIVSAMTRIDQYFTNYVGSQTDECVANTVSYPIPPPTNVSWFAVMDGKITHARTGTTGSAAVPVTEDVRVQLWYNGEATTIQMQATHAAHSGHIQNVTSEYRRPLIYSGDLDEDGDVDGFDFTIFKQGYFATAICGCANYWTRL